MKSHDSKILLAGILALIVAMGVARFSFTTLLPFMLEDLLTLSSAGVMASINYAGYLSGAILAIFIKDIYKKSILFKIGMALAVGSTLFLGISENLIVINISRYFAGFGSAFGLVVGSALVMYKLHSTQKVKVMAIHFSGIGFGIVVSDIFARVMMIFVSWEQTWIYMTIFGALLAIYPSIVLNIKKPKDSTQSVQKIKEYYFTPFVFVLIVAYFCAGIGFVIDGTFLPTIIKQTQGLESYDALIWIIVGLSAIPSCILWGRIGQRYGSVNAIVYAFVIQGFGMLIPVFFQSALMYIIAAILYGGTFAGLVSLFLALGGKLGGKNPVVIMGALTTAYSVGQIIGPLYAVALAQWKGDFTLSLLVTAVIVFGGALLVFVAKKITHFQEV